VIASIQWSLEFTQLQYPVVKFLMEKPSFKVVDNTYYVIYNYNIYATLRIIFHAINIKYGQIGNYFDFSRDLYKSKIEFELY